MAEIGNNERYCTAKQIAHDPAFCFTVFMLQYYIFHADNNGLSTALHRVGRKVPVRRDLFIDWLEQISCQGDLS